MSSRKPSQNTPFPLPMSAISLFYTFVSTIRLEMVLAQRPHKIFQCNKYLCSEWTSKGCTTLDFQGSSSSAFRLYFWTNVFSKMCIFLHITHLPFHCPHLLVVTPALSKASWFPFWAQPAFSKTDLFRQFSILLYLLNINKFVLFIYFGCIGSSLLRAGFL